MPIFEPRTNLTSMLKPHIFLVCLLTLSASLWSCDSSDSSPETFAPEDLIGTWTLSHGSFEDNPDYTGGMGEWTPHESDWKDQSLIIDKDSIRYMHYPYQYFEANAYQLEGNLLKVVQNTEGHKFYADTYVERRGDSLIRTYSSNEYVFHDHFFLDTLDSDTLAILLRDTVNIHCLVGTWHVDLWIGGDMNDGSEASKVLLPFTLPDSLVFTEAELKGMSGRNISVPANGSPRQFRFTYDESHSILLEPVQWKEGETVTYRYMGGDTGEEVFDSKFEPLDTNSAYTFMGITYTRWKQPDRWF